MHVGMRTDDFDFALLQKQKLDSVGSYKNQPGDARKRAALLWQLKLTYAVALVKPNERGATAK